MKTPTSILMGGGLVAAAYGFIFWSLHHAHKRSQQAETGHDRAEQREWHWYWNKDRNENTEKISAKGPLS
jgi:hypothetical protein